MFLQNLSGLCDLAIASFFTFILATAGIEADSAKISSFDKFLFIGDSRYEGISDKLKSLGSNITVCSAVGSSPKEWIEVARNGSGTVKGKAQTLPGTATNISVMLGVNNPSETAQMEQLLNSLHSRYSNCKVFVNSVYNVGSAYSGGVTNDSIKKYTDAMKLVKECDEKLKNIEEQVNKMVLENGEVKDFELED